jgi:hypothetical protein
MGRDRQGSEPEITTRECQTVRSGVQGESSARV